VAAQQAVLVQVLVQQVAQRAREQLARAPRRVPRVRLPEQRQQLARLLEYPWPQPPLLVL
jgi:hypothetical protein